MKNRVLFVTEKFCDGTPNLGLTNNFHNLFNTFSQAYGDHYNFNAIHLDEAAVVYSTHIDNILAKYCLQWDIKVVIYSLLGQSPVNPSLTTYKLLKDMGVYQAFMWPDCGPGWGVQTIQQLGGLSNLNVIWDNPRSAFHASVPKDDKWLELWVPQDTTMFYPDVQNTLVSFIGSDRYPDRAHYLGSVKRAMPELVGHLRRGGQREEKLSPETYAKLIRTSSIGINFAASPAGFWQTKGRIFEILASKSMLLETNNPATEALFTPDKDYVGFSNAAELIEKIKYYTSHPEERKAIAEQGYQTYMNKYTSRHFWREIMSRIEKDKSWISRA